MYFKDLKIYISFFIGSLRANTLNTLTLCLILLLLLNDVILTKASCTGQPKYVLNDYFIHILPWEKNFTTLFPKPNLPKFFFMKINMALFKEAPNHPNALPSHPDSILETSLVLKFSIPIHQSRLGFFNDLFLRGYRVFRIVFSLIFWIES